MQIQNTATGWGMPARLLHWVVAFLVIAQVALGWVAVTRELSPTKLHLFVWHKSIGMLVLALVVLRLAWRLANPTPALPPGTAPWELAAARASHALLYALLLAMPLDGWLLNSAAGVPFSIFWTIPLPAVVHPDEHLAEFFKGVHFWMFVILSGLLAVHVAAALRHHFVKRNAVLVRMLRGAEKAG